MNRIIKPVIIVFLVVLLGMSSMFLIDNSFSRFEKIISLDNRYGNIISSDDFEEIIATEFDIEDDSIEYQNQSDTIPKASENEENYQEICKIRDEMTERNETISLEWRFSDNTGDTDKMELCENLITKALSEEYAVSYNTGDYLLHNLKDYAYEVSSKGNDAVITYSITYLDTNEQENKLKKALDSVMTKIDVNDLDDYEKSKKIYEYITSNVKYDDAAYDAIKQGEDMDLSHTAYAALIEGEAVCQGFANLFYAMGKLAGLNVSIVAGKAGDTMENHAWNLVEIDGKTYFLDSTWDSQKPVRQWKYYMLSEKEIKKDHVFEK